MRTWLMKMTDKRCEHGVDAAGWVLSALSREEAQRFAAHLPNCASCRAEVARLTNASQRLSHTADPHVPRPELRERLMASVRAEVSLFDAARADGDPAEPINAPRRSRLRPSMPVPALAILVIGIAVVILLVARG